MGGWNDIFHNESESECEIAKKTKDKDVYTKILKGGDILC